MDWWRRRQDDPTDAAGDIVARTCGNIDSTTTVCKSISKVHTHVNPKSVRTVRGAWGENPPHICVHVVHAHARTQMQLLRMHAHTQTSIRAIGHLIGRRCALVTSRISPNVSTGRPKRKVAVFTLLGARCARDGWWRGHWWNEPNERNAWKLFAVTGQRSAHWQHKHTHTAARQLMMMMEGCWIVCGA